MLKIEKLNESHESLIINLDHQKALLRALAPNPAEWVFTGKVADAGSEGARCACGHEIRWCFQIERKGEFKHDAQAEAKLFARIQPCIQCQLGGTK